MIQVLWAAWERTSEGQGAGELAGLALRAVPERWAFRADIRLIKLEKDSWSLRGCFVSRKGTY